MRQSPRGKDSEVKDQIEHLSHGLFIKEETINLGK